MPGHTWQRWLLLATVLLGLGACTGNYKFSDADYRPLGEPPLAHRNT